MGPDRADWNAPVNRVNIGVMNDRPSLKAPRILLATWFGSGYAPKAPGTMGSLAALPVGWIIAVAGGWEGLFAAALLVTFVGVWAANGYMAESGSHDPGPVVIDEVAGQWLAMVPAAALGMAGVPGITLAFGLFRLFDILKPWPISWADRHVGGGFGVMLDDVLAGVAAGLVWMAIYRWVPGAPALIGG